MNALVRQDIAFAQVCDALFPQLRTAVSRQDKRRLAHCAYAMWTQLLEDHRLETVLLNVKTGDQLLARPDQFYPEQPLLNDGKVTV